MEEFSTYPVGLRLAGRDVLVVGGGSVAQRRVPGLIAAGAVIRLVAPTVTAALQALAESGEIAWIERAFEENDLDGCWYVIAATDDPDVNARVGEVAFARRIFCVRSDDADAGTAWTPAVGRHEEVSIAVLGDRRETRNPRETARLRDEIMHALETGAYASVRPAAEPGVTLVGGGPGDPTLISVAGRAALLSADVVVADRLAPREMLGGLAPDVELIDVAKLPRGRSAQQREINRVIVERALAGKRVVRFKGGDNFIFGRGFEEVIACRKAGVPVRVIPGLTSPVTVPGIAGIPVTHRGVNHDFTVISGHLPPSDPASLVAWDAVAGGTGTLVLMMAVRNAPQIAEKLLAGARSASTPAAVICDGTMPTERVVLCTLGELASSIETEKVRPPAIIVIGEVVAVAHPERFGRG